MHSLAVAGFLLALVVAHALVAAFCLAAWAQRRTSGDLLLFGLLNTALVLFAAGLAPAYAFRGDLAVELALAEAGRVAATATLVDFVLRYARVKSPRWTLGALYGVAGALVLTDLLGLLGGAAGAEHELVHVAGLELRSLALPPTALGTTLTLASLGAACFAAFTLARAYARGQREGLALTGAVLLAITASYDAARALGVASGPPLAPYGFAAFVQGVTLTLISRFGSLRRQLERQASALDDRTAALARSYDELRATQDELVRKEQLAAIGELSAVIAHEVRNPLAIISNAVSTLRRPEVSAEDRSTLLGILDEESSRLNRLVGNLLRYARPVNLERQLVSVRELVERSLAVAVGNPDIVAELHELEPVDKIWGDPNLLRQVVENLFTNAMQAMSDGGTLTVTLVKKTAPEGARGVELQIQDTGEGMDTLVRSRALDPFFTTRPSGTGLGLAIVARIIDAHGGQLRIKSAAGAGTVMLVFLPHTGEPAKSALLRSEPPDRGPSSLPPMPAELRKAIGARPKRR